MVNLRFCALLACTLVACDHDGGTDPTEVDLWPIPSAGSVVSLDASVPRDAQPTWLWDAWSPPRDAATDAARDSAVDAAKDAAPTPDLTLQVFDPEQVYLMGTLSPGACYRDAVAPVTQPERAVVGFSCDVAHGSAQIRSTDGSLLYLNSVLRSPYIFRCDGCTLATSAANYPLMTEANDVRLPSPACTGLTQQFLIARDGKVMHRCGSDWSDEAGTKVASGEILAFGVGGTALSKAGIVRLSDGQLTPFVGLSSPQILAVRTREDGYWLATVASDPGAVPQLWQVALDATATLVGTYPQLPSGQQQAASHKLDGLGRLVQLARTMSSAGTLDTIVRRSVEGESAVIYDELTNPVLKVHISYLVTGI